MIGHISMTVDLSEEELLRLFYEDLYEDCETAFDHLFGDYLLNQESRPLEIKEPKTDGNDPKDPSPPKQPPPTKPSVKPPTVRPRNPTQKPRALHRGPRRR
jgi:hypothetical protein